MSLSTTAATTNPKSLTDRLLPVLGPRLETGTFDRKPGKHHLDSLPCHHQMVPHHSLLSALRLQASEAWPAHKAQGAKDFGPCGVRPNSFNFPATSKQHHVH